MQPKSLAIWIMRIPYVVLLLLLTATLSNAQSDSLILQSKADEMLNTSTQFVEYNTPYTHSLSSRLLKNEPISLTVFTSEEIEKLGFDNLYDLLNYLPGFQSFENVSAYGTMPKVTVRGVHHELNSSVLILLNGKRLNDALFSSATAMLKYFNLRIISRVEVARGTGLVRFGNESYTGIINLISNTDKTDAILDFRSPFGVSLSGNATKNLGTTSKFSISGATMETAGFNYNFQGARTRSPSTTNQLIAGYETAKFRTQAFYSSHATRDFLEFGYLANSINRTLDQTFHLNLDYDYVDTERLFLSASVFGTYSRKETVALLQPKSRSASGEDWIGGPILKGVGLNARTDGKYKMSDNNRMNFGLAVINNNVGYIDFLTNHYSADFLQISPDSASLQSSIREIENPLKLAMERRSQLNYSGYLEFDFNLSDKWSISVGSRAEKYNIVSKIEVNPKASFIYHSSNSTIKLVGSTSSRLPSLAERYFNTFTLNGNNSLAVERSQSAEFIYLQNYEYSSFEVSLFYSRQENRIFYDHSIESWRNQESESIMQGAEASLNANISKRIKLHLNYSVALGDLSSLVFEHYGNLGLNYHNNKWNIHLSSLYRGKISESENLNSQRANDFDEIYFLVNLKMTRYVNPRLALFVFGNNITNMRAKTQSDNLISTGGFPLIAQGVEIRAGIKFQFGFTPVEEKNE